MIEDLLGAKAEHDQAKTQNRQITKKIFATLNIN